MIGQNKLKCTLKNNSPFSPFIILVGDKGSGRKTILRELFPEAIWYTDCKIDSVRDMMRMALDVHDSLFIMADIDNMSIGAKNAILKLVEEPPNNNRIIMTLENENNTLPTIRSRATFFYMDDYTPNEFRCC